jgi:TRAP-type C4-dicarboxylate transport system substrate-binding protein
VIPHRLSGVAALGALALLLCGCSGGEQATVGVDELSIATLGSVTPSEQAFLDRMDELSEGSIDLNVAEDWEGSGGDPDEIALTKAVAAGDVDVAWVSIRSLRANGDEGIDALEAPLLIQTHDQQRAVALGVPGELVTIALRNTSVAGLALMPGPTEYPIATDAPLLGVEDWAGKTVQVGASSPAESATVEALGATASTDGADGAADVVSGVVPAATADPRDLVASGVVTGGPVMTANVALWSRMSIVLINRDVLDRLSSRQHGFLDASVVRAQDVAMNEAPDLATAVSEACAAGALFGLASADQLAALHDAVRPVYDALAEDPDEAKLLAAIREAVKSHAGTGALSPASSCHWVAPAV